MKTETNSIPCPSAFTGGSLSFCRDLVAAVGKLKGRLRAKFEAAHPGRSPVIQQVLAEAEELVWSTAFPQLLLPDFAEAMLAAMFPSDEPALARAA